MHYSQYIFLFLSILLIIGSFCIILQSVIDRSPESHTPPDPLTKDGHKCAIRSIYADAATNLFVLISSILLFGAIVHFALALIKHDDMRSFKEEIIPAVIMSACAITLVALHQGIDMFLEKGSGVPGKPPYASSDAYLIAFIVVGGIFIIGALWLVCTNI